MNNVNQRYLARAIPGKVTIKDSPNTGWRNASFRGFADYMQTEEFEQSIEKLIEAAEKRATVIMCAEAVPWRCHRTLVGDALLVRGVQVRHIMSAGSSRDHTLTPWAKVKRAKITYPSELGAQDTAKPITWSEKQVKQI